MGGRSARRTCALTHYSPPDLQWPLTRQSGGRWLYIMNCRKMAAGGNIMQNYKVYNDVERKMIKLKNGHRYLVDMVLLKRNDDRPDQYLAIGYETATNKRYGWVELNDDDPVDAFVSYVEMTDKIEREEIIKELDKKHS